jgi:hypothetical protein
VHILHDLVRRRYVGGWIPLAQEIRRICREPHLIYDDTTVAGDRDARIHVERLVQDGAWASILDFVERLHDRLPIDGLAWSDDANDWQIRTSRSAVQEYIISEISTLLLEENLAFEFRSGRVWRRGRLHTTETVSRAEVVMGDPRLEQARKHYSKALKYFRQASNPDWENSVKEAVCAVEAAAKALFPDAKGKTLGEVITSITGRDEAKLPKTIANTFHGLYGFRSGGTGVGHGGSTGGKATESIAEYILAVAASQIILLVDLANNDNDVAF